MPRNWKKLPRKWKKGYTNIDIGYVLRLSTKTYISTRSCLSITDAIKIYFSENLLLKNTAAKTRTNLSMIGSTMPTALGEI